MNGYHGWKSQRNAHGAKQDLIILRGKKNNNKQKSGIKKLKL